MQGQLQRALQLTRTVELRLDWLRNQREVATLLEWLRTQRRREGTTLLATCRRIDAGGKFAGTVLDQLAILRLAIECGCACADVEIESARQLRTGGLSHVLGPGGQVVSYHNFKETPRSLDAKVRELEHAGGTVAKVATQCESIADSLRILKLARSKSNVIAIPMGAAGLPARVLALREGSALAYAPVEEATAPGQVSLEEFKRVYRADKLNLRTKVFGVIGNPVSHSLSPRM